MRLLPQGSLRSIRRPVVVLVRNVSTEMALHVLAYNMKRVTSVLSIGGLMEAIRA
jgi:hypothetical protein